MITFEQALSSTYTEILAGEDYIAFNVIGERPCEIYFTETASTPAASNVGTLIYPKGTRDAGRDSLNVWDYEGGQFTAGTQRVWVKGNSSVTVRGVIGS